MTPRGLNSGKKGLIRKGSFEVQREAVATMLVETVSAGSSARCVDDRGIPPDQHLKPSFDYLSDGTDHTGEVAAPFRLTRRALQASEALEKQLTLADVFVVESIDPLFMGFLHDSAGLAAGDPPCIGSKGS